ncbi:MAG: MBL fold metallo-hydrolase [Methanoregula sp.]|nr:MBL fold metallo-hydrolase [Methanoregula sp.]
MLFERVFSEGLAHYSYIIGDAGKAAVIDPRRDGDIYLEIAARNNCTITHIFETHRNEDYVIGSLPLAHRCGAGIFHGAAMDFAYGNKVHEGDTFTFGSLSVQVLDTPGHTGESISLVVRDLKSGEAPYLVFCGDTIFAGDIARTDFFGDDRKEEMAQKIHDSITQKILTLGDGVILCPAHGAGSACGGDITDHPFTTTGYEKTTNPLIRMGRDAFVSLRKTESPYMPPYFHTMEQYNRDGPPILHAPPFIHPLTVPELEHLRKDGCQLLDIRAPGGFAGGHIPGSLSVWRGGISSFAGWFLNYTDPIVIVDDYNQNIEQVVRHLFRMGYDTISGILAGGIAAWYRSGGEIGTVGTCSVRELRERLDRSSPFLLDVRDIRNRRAIGYIGNSHHVYVGELPRHLEEIPADEPVVVYCDAGYKAGIAASILAQHGYRDVTNVLGGMTAWKQAGFRIEH